LEQAGGQHEPRAHRDPDDPHETVQQTDAHRIEAALDEPDREREGAREREEPDQLHGAECVVGGLDRLELLAGEVRGHHRQRNPNRDRSDPGGDRAIDRHHQHELRLFWTAGLGRPVQIDRDRDE
jgi:hypothetical protein